MKTLAVSPDSKMAFVANDNDIPRVFDLATGRVLYSLNWGSIEVGAFSPDGRTIAAQQGCDLCVFDAATGKALRTINGPRTNSWCRDLVEFTPDGKAFAVTSVSLEENRLPRPARIHLIDFESGRTIRDFSIENLSVLALAFSPDGKLMASGGYDNDKEDYFARLWNVESGKEIRRFVHGKKGYGIASLAFSPDGKTLGTLGTQAGVFLRLFDVETGKELREFPKDGDQRTNRGSVAFSPDGKTVAVALGSIVLYDATKGTERLRIDKTASNLHFTDGGKTLTAAVSGTIYRWDTDTGKSLILEAADSTVEQILVTADGGRVVTRGQDGEAHIWDGTNAKHLRRFHACGDCGLAMSPDGRFLAWPVSDDRAKFSDPLVPDSILYGSRIRLYEIAADKFIDRFPAFKGDTHDLAFTNEGKQLVTADHRAGMVRIWNFETAEEERSFHVMTDALKKRSFMVSRSSVSPDGKTVGVEYFQWESAGITNLGSVAGPPKEIRLWDVATGRELPQLKGGSPIGRAFSTDGRLVVTRGENCVCEIATGKPVALLPNDPLLYIRAAAFSRDGRYLATAVPEDVIQIWEVATWTKRNEFKGYHNRSIALTFGPGGQLFTGNQDTTVLVWDMRPPRVADSVSLESAVDDLEKWEAGESFKSMGRFLSSPTDTVKLFAERIKPGEPRDPKGITSEQLREIRAVMVLEQIDGEESRNLLKKWAGGLKGALLTEEALAALKRLEGTTKAKR